MTLDNFNILIESIALPIGREFEKQFNASFLLNAEQLHMEYQKQKLLFRLLCNKVTHDDSSKNLLDRHKVCAALCVALIKLNPIYVYQDISDSTIRRGSFYKIIGFFNLL